MTTDTYTSPIGLSNFFLGEMEGSHILDEDGGGYDPQIASRIRSAPHTSRGITVYLTAHALSDLAEFADAMVLANEQGGNPSGARACRQVRDTARARSAQAAAAEETA